MDTQPRWWQVMAHKVGLLIQPPDTRKPGTIPWWRKDKDGWPIETWRGRPVASAVRILFQNIRKVTG